MEPNESALPNYPQPTSSDAAAAGRAPSHSPSSPPPSLRYVSSPPCHGTHQLNPNAATFSLATTSPAELEEGTPDWLRFSPSLSEGRSSAPALPHRRVPLLTLSATKVRRR
jgi:hypothetical protein